MAAPASSPRIQSGPLDGVASAVAAVLRSARAVIGLALRTPAGRIGLPLVMLHLVLALFGSALSPYPATEFHIEEHQLEAPSLQFLLGTDQFGRDVLSRVMSGATSLVSVSVAGAMLGIILGTVVGMSSGYKGGRTDEVVMRIMDGMMSFPSLLIALLVLTSLGPNSINIVGTIGVVFIAPVARVMRSSTLAVKNLEFVDAARLRGEPAIYIVFREILPNALPVLAVEASVRFSYAILLVASLGFLGLGVQPPSSDWGLMISESRIFIVAAPWVALAPGVAVASLVIGVNLLADGIRQAGLLPVKGDEA